MYTFALDEYGDFERIDSENDSLLIGGIIYDDKDIKDELKNENKRIRSYYKAVIKEASVVCNMELKYPKCLHTGNIYDNNVIKEVKIIVTETLPEFLQNGTYRGNDLKDDGMRCLPKRNGLYMVFGDLISDVAKSKRIDEDADFLLKDNYASNLYFHMASDTISRAVFFNPLIEKESSFNLIIASRSSDTYKSGDDILEDYKAAGYDIITHSGRGDNKKKLVYKIRDEKREVIGECDGARIQVTNSDVYRTLVSEFVSENNPNNMKVKKFGVYSINYKSGGHDSKYLYEMLYLADSVVSYMSYHLKNKNRKTSDRWLKELNKRMCNLLPIEQNLLFVYDDVDTQFGKALEYYRNNNYYDALKICFYSGNQNSMVSEFYKKRWFKFVSECIEQSSDYGAFVKAVNDYYNSIFVNDYNQNLGIYVLSALEKTANNIKMGIRNIEGYRPIARLYETAMTAYCHMGDSVRAEEYYNKLMSYASLIDIESILRIRDMLCVCYSDCFLWDKALVLSTQTVKIQKEVSDTKYKLLNGMNCIAINEAKSLSQLGQMYSFCRDRHAQGAFLEALDLFDTGSTNYFISMSYLLHHYIDIKDERAFEEYAEIYFAGKKSVSERLDYIIEEGLKENSIVSLKFALYLFYKYVYTFRLADIDSVLWKKIQNIEEYVNNKKCCKKSWYLSGHPTELIYKYIALIAIAKNDNNTLINAEKVIKVYACENNTVSAIAKYSLVCVADAKEDRLLRRKRLNNLMCELKDNYKVFEKIQTDKINSDKIMAILYKYFTFMYV